MNVLVFFSLEFSAWKKYLQNTRVLIGHIVALGIRFKENSNETEQNELQIQEFKNTFKYFRTLICAQIVYEFRNTHFMCSLSQKKWAIAWRKW